MLAPRKGSRGASSHVLSPFDWTCGGAVLHLVQRVPHPHHGQPVCHQIVRLSRGCACQECATPGNRNSQEE